MMSHTKKRLLASTAASFALTISAGLAHAGHADVNIATDTDGVDLDAQAGATVHVQSGATVSAHFPGPQLDGISATSQPWTVTNDGTIEAGNNGVVLEMGGSLVNGAGGLIQGDSSGAVFGNWLTNAGAATVDNSGRIIGGPFGEGVTLFGGGTVTNRAGALIQANSGNNALSLSGGTGRTVLNSGIIENIQAGGWSTGILIQSGGGSGTTLVTNTATGEIRGGYNAIYAQNLGVNGITIRNEGGLIESTNGPAVELSNISTAQVINSGTIRNLGSAPAVTMNNSGVVDNAGTITGGGATAIAFTGNHDNVLGLHSGSVIDGLVDGGGGTDVIYLYGTGAETLAKFIDFERLVKYESSAWTLTGSGTIHQSARIEQGTLVLEGVLTTPTLTVMAGNGARLAGSGTVVGNVIANGIVAPGNSIGTLDVTNATFGAGSVLEVEIDGLGNVAGVNNDLLNASGTVTINGGTIRVAPENGTDSGQAYIPGLDYTVISALGGVTGQFDGIADGFAYLDFTPHYDDPSRVYIVSSAATPNFCLDGMTVNQCAAGDGVFSLGAGGSLFAAVLNLSAAEAPVALDRLSGEIHASALGGLVEDSRFPREAALARLREAFSGGTDDTGFWAEGFGAWGERDGDGNAGAVTRSTGGLLLGGDVDVAENLRFGVFGGYGQSSLDVPDRNSTASATSYHLGAYGGAAFGNLRLSLGAVHAWHKVSAARQVAFTGFSDSLAADYGARTAQVFGEAAYGFDVGSARLEPFANLAYVRVSTDGYAETGGAAALSGAGSEMGLGFSTLGLRAESAMELGEARVLLSGAAGWRHAFGDVTPLAAHALSGGAAFTVAGLPVARDALVLDLAAGVELSPGANLTFSYGGQFGAGFTDQSARLDLKVSF